MIKKKFKNKRIPLLVLGTCLVGGLMGAFVIGAMADETAETAGIYGLTPMAQLYVFVDGSMDGELGGKVEAGSVVTVKAPEVNGKTFQYWAVGSADGPKASYLSAYQLAVNADTSLYAVYGNAEQEKKPAAAITAAVKWKEGDGTEAIRMTTTFSVPGDLTVSDAGIVYTDNTRLGVVGEKDLTVGSGSTPDVKALLTGGENRRLRKVSADKEGAVTIFTEGTEAGSGSSGTQPAWSIGEGSWKLNQADWSLTLLSPGEDMPVYAVAYVTVGDETYYSDVMTMVYNKLGNVSLEYTPAFADEIFDVVSGTSGTVKDELEAAIEAKLKSEVVSSGTASSGTGE